MLLLQRLDAVDSADVARIATVSRRHTGKILIAASRLLIETSLIVVLASAKGEVLRSSPAHLNSTLVPATCRGVVEEVAGKSPCRSTIAPSAISILDHE